MKPHCPGKKGCPANEWSPGCAHTPLSEENRCSVTQMKYPKPIPLEYVGYAEGVLSSVPDPFFGIAKVLCPNTTDGTSYKCPQLEGMWVNQPIRTPGVHFKHRFY